MCCCRRRRCHRCEHIGRCGGGRLSRAAVCGHLSRDLCGGLDHWAGHHGLTVRPSLFAAARARMVGADATTAGTAGTAAAAAAALMRFLGGRIGACVRQAEDIRQLVRRDGRRGRRALPSAARPHGLGAAAPPRVRVPRGQRREGPPARGTIWDGRSLCLAMGLSRRLPPLLLVRRQQPFLLARQLPLPLLVLLVHLVLIPFLHGVPRALPRRLALLLVVALLLLLARPRRVVSSSSCAHSAQLSFSSVTSATSLTCVFSGAASCSSTSSLSASASSSGSSSTSSLTVEPSSPSSAFASSELDAATCWTASATLSRSSPGGQSGSSRM